MIVMGCCVILSSVHQKTLIEAIDRLNDADVIMAGYTGKIDWRTSRNYMTGNKIRRLLNGTEAKVSNFSNFNFE